MTYETGTSEQPLKLSDRVAKNRTRNLLFRLLRIATGTTRVFILRLIDQVSDDEPETLATAIALVNKDLIAGFDGNRFCYLRGAGPQPILDILAAEFVVKSWILAKSTPEFRQRFQKAMEAMP